MLGVGRFAGDFKAQQSNHRGAGVGKVVDRIGSDGDAVEQQSDQRLYQKEKDVGKHAHHRSQNTVALAHLRLLGLLVVGNKVPNQKLYHENSSSLFGSLGWSPQMKDRADSDGIPYKNDLTTTIDCTAK